MGLPPEIAIIPKPSPPVASPQAMTVASARRAAKALSLGTSDAAETDTLW